MDKLSDSEVAGKLTELVGWELMGQSIEKDFEFADFKSAFGFMSRLAEVAESLNHHPDWSNTYNKVHISLTSHEAKGLTDKDFSFALAADAAAKDLL